MTLSYRHLRHLAALSLLSVAACAAEHGEDAGSEGADLSSIQSYFSDARKLDLNDLERVTAGFATDGLNSALSVGSSSGTHIGVTFDAPSVYAATAMPNKVLPTSDQVQGLDQIVGGLSAQFGETELGTEVNKVRLEHLTSSTDKYFVESAFTTDVGLGPSWSFPASGFGNGLSVTLGLQADAALTSRVIVATTDDGLDALVTTPLQAVQGMRGFVYPRSMADVRAMKPGEMFALRGKGSLGANFGVGAPIFVADPTALSYRIVVSAGVSGVVSGLVDVQLVRLDGDEIVVDVGVENGSGTSFHAGIADGWGIKGLCDDGKPCLRDVSIGGKTVGLAGLVENAVANQMNKYLTFSVSEDGSNTSSRISLSRFRMHMDRGNAAENDVALQQLLKFDLRLAQAMYNRDLAAANPAVTADYDAMRAATTTTRNFGFEVLGMNIYSHAVTSKDGTFTIQTPDGDKSILFDTIQKSGGWFMSKHGYTRTGVAAQTVNAANPTALDNEANLFIETMSSDSHMSNDFGSDNVDALLVGVGGRDLLDTLDQYGDKLQQTLWARCPVQTSQDDGGQQSTSWDEKCNEQLLADPTFTGIKTAGLAAIEPKIAGLSDDYKNLVRAAANVRLTLQSTGINDFSALGGPGFAFTTDARFDDQALAILSTKTQADYMKALGNYLGAVNHDRMQYAQPSDIDAVAATTEKKAGDAITKMASLFAADTASYNAIMTAEKGLPTLLAGKKFVAQPMGIRFTISDDQNAMMASAVLKSTAQDRSAAASKLFDDLLNAANDVGSDLNNEQMALYPLLALVPAAHLEVAMKVDAQVSSNFFVDRDNFIKAGLKSVNATATGANVATIGAGMFDLQAMINASDNQ